MYSTDAAPFGQVFCFACHGSSAGGSLTYMNEKGGSEAYSNTAGDHNQAQYDAAGNPSNVAHDDEVVLYTQRNPASNPGPLTNCQACHNEHAAASSSLADYRSSGTTAATYKQAGLCYACHSASSVETRSVGAVPFAWNGRDVRAQFAKTSKHPTSSKTGSPVPEGGSWLQTTEEHFATDTHTRTEVVAGGSGTSGAVQLAPFGGAAGTVFEDDFETGDFSKWDSSNWGIDGSAANAHGGSNSAVMNTTGADELMVKTVDAAGRTNVQISFWLKGTNTTENTDYIQLQVYNTGTTTWDTIRNIPLDDRVTTYRQFVDSIPASYYSATMRFRIVGRCNMADEYQHVDDVAVTADPVAGSFEPNGNVVSTPVLVTGGTLNSWNTLRYTGNQTAGSTFRIDVLDGADSSVLVSDLTLADTPYSLAGIDEVAHPSLKLRARFAGDAPLPPSVSDDFNDNSFDTSKWTDLFINSTDPDSGAPVPWTSAAEPFTNLSNWTVQQSSDAEWVSQASDGNPVPCAEVRWRSGGSTNRTPAYMTRVYDTSGKSNLYVTFDWRQNGTSGGDWLTVEVSTNGSVWTPIWNEGDATPTNWTSASTAAGTVPASSTLYVRFGGALRGSGRYYRVDNFQIHGTAPGTPTDLWPDESGGQLTIRAEGTDFGGTADEGEFTYIKPTVASWIAGNDFEAVVYVPSYNNLGANGWMKTGLMLRTGSTEANAQAAGAKMAGIYVTDTNGINFEYRTTAGGASASGGTQAGDAPMWLKLGRVGNVITGYMSTDGSSWTPVGSQTVSLDTYVLVGVCLTSHVNGTFSESTFDNFSVTQLGGSGSTVTPRLDDWSVDYIWTPSPTGSGSLTCYNCHNTHYVQRGAAGTVWSMTRASDPDNTKSAYSGTVTTFCLKCHDGVPPTAVTNQSNKLVPYNVILRDMSAYPFFPGWNKDAAGLQFSSSGHAATTINRLVGQFGCDTCHDPHASDNQRLTALSASGGATGSGHLGVARNNTATYGEEELCLACHDSSRSGMCSSAGCHGVSLGFIDVDTPLAATYAHPIDTSGAHRDTEDATDLGVGNRHAECADCHDPHATRPGVHTQGSSDAGPALRGATGVKPDYSGLGVWEAPSSYAVERMDGGADDFETYVCFKCHSGYTTRPNTPSGGYAQTDVALEFNPNNESGHNVMGDAFTRNITRGSYTWYKSTDLRLAAGWTIDSEMTCSDCHSYNAAGARGPHGSAIQFILKGGTAGTAWYTVAVSNWSNTALLCNRCHTASPHGSWMPDKSDHTELQCRHCHITIPHGWKRPRMLVAPSDPAPYRNTGNGGTFIGVELQNVNQDIPDKNTCVDTACGGRHEPDPGDVYW
ncbi:MAG: cytochrome c3 family protein [Coriobacteriia bacterium]|nr:cytochrome c3 family protein [Coriobacteriia bacterium]